MKLDVSTGQTKSPPGTVLVPVVLGDSKSDRIFILIHSEGKEEGADHLRKECVNVLTHVVMEGEGEVYVRLESALKELNGLLKGFMLSDTVSEVRAIVGVVERNGNLHLSHIGRSEAYLVRDGSAAQITEYSRGKPPQAFMHIVSGPVQERDHIIISTQRLLRAITPAQLAQIVARGGDTVKAIASQLEGEREVACIAHIAIHSHPQAAVVGVAKTASRGRLLVQRERGRRGGSQVGVSLLEIVRRLIPTLSSIKAPAGMRSAVKGKVKNVKGQFSTVVGKFAADLHDPARKRRAHLLLLAGAAAVFLVAWMTIQLSLSSQKSQNRGELAALMQQINADITTADNRQLAGDADSANAILQSAENRARQVMSNESGLFRRETSELLARINSKREEMNKVVRVVPPRVMANLSAKKPDILAQGFMGLPNGEFIVYDRQDLYRVSLNSVEPSDRISAEELLLEGVVFSRFQSRVFLTTGNSIIELINGQPITMKTEDPAGWVTGVDIKTYLRYLYILAPERKQIYKYERLSSRYGPPAEYNVNGDLSGALDMTITGAVYVLKDVSIGKAPDEPGTREVLKLLRGEKQPFTIRNLPPGALDGVTKIFKSSATGNFYFMDPVNKRIVVTTNDGDLGDSLYLKQFVLDSDQVGKLKDVFVDENDTRLYVLDEKKLYAIDLQAN